MGSRFSCVPEHGFVLRPPWEVVDTCSLERGLAACSPGWRETGPFAPPIPNEALTALELARELLA
jgi:hypothetical protein